MFSGFALSYMPRTYRGGIRNAQMIEMLLNKGVGGETQAIPSRDGILEMQGCRVGNVCWNMASITIAPYILQS